jgi:predicted enzyme related to lactoylglutathione lyase
MQDVSPGGQLLLTRDDQPYRMLVRAPRATREADVSWLDASIAPRLSRDGSLLAFTNGGFDADVNYHVMLRKTEGVRWHAWARGRPPNSPPDGKWLLAFVPSVPPKLVLYPTRAGAERPTANAYPLPPSATSLRAPGRDRSSSPWRTIPTCTPTSSRPTSPRSSPWTGCADNAEWNQPPVGGVPQHYARTHAMNLNQVTLPAVDLAAGVAFYQRLGLRLIVDALPRYARLECPDGESTLSLEQVTQLGSGPSPVVYLECADLDTTVERLTAEGIRFDTPPTDQPWLWREARLRDPAGNALCLFYAGRNRRDPPWRVGAPPPVRASEAG